MGYQLIKWSIVEYFEIIDLISLEWQPSDGPGYLSCHHLLKSSNDVTAAPSPQSSS